MNLQGRNLKLDLRGADVRLLQFELRLLRLDLPEEEALENHFGEGTREAVLQLQEQLDLEVDGIVGSATARRINVEVRQRVPADDATEQLAQSVKRTLEQIDALGPNADNLRAHIKRFSGTLQAFTIALDTLRQLDAPDDLAAEVEEMLDAGRTQLEELAASSDDGDTTSFVVRGHIVGHELCGLPGFQVVALDKNVGRDVPLGEGTSGEGGAYEIRYPSERLQGKAKPDVQVHVLNDTGKVLATSVVRYDASREESDLDVVVPAEKLPRIAEYQRLTAELSAHVNGNGQSTRFADLKEDDERQDITYLANKTGWDARLVAMTALAERFGEQSGLRPELFYALFRSGLPANEDTLSQANPKMLETLWSRAADEGIISEDVRDEIPESLERFREYGARRLLEAPATAGVSSLSELLDISLNGDDERKKRFARLYAEHRGDLDGFWQSIHETFGEETTDRLQLDGRLSFLTLNNADLVRRLHETTEILSTPLDLVKNGLYKSENWEALLTAGESIPAEIPGTNGDEKKENYARFMAAQLRLSYPTAVVAEMVRENAIPLAAQEAREGVYMFLTEHQGQFELGVHPVEQYLATHDLELDEATLAPLKTLQRVYQISPSDEAMAGLMTRNVDSAYAAVQYGEQAFVSSFQQAMGGEATARLTYAKAHQVHNATLNVATTYLLNQTAPSLYAVSGSTTLNGASADGAGNGAGGDGADTTGVLAYPTLEGLFGEMDYCACEHCRSVLSPAAYLVDLLQFIDLKRYNSAGVELPPTYDKENPLDVLLACRPDLAHLQLTCENTNTVLPYVDLVNEILEYFVANGVTNGDFSLNDFEGHNIDEEARTEDLLASPQFVNGTAYDHLQQEVYPLALPFHQPLEALRQYFECFEVPLHEAMERLRASDDFDRDTDDDYGWRDILMERLGLSRPEYDVLTGDDASLQALYGEDPGTVSVEALRNQLSNAKTLSRRMGITYEDLIEILRTRFVNPNSYLLPRLEKLYVNFKTLEDLHDGVIDAAAFRDLLPDDLDEAAYGGDVVQWINDYFDAIMGLIVLSDPTGSDDLCNFDEVELRYAQPDFATNWLRPVEFLKLLRFIRLWKKLGWTIEQADKAIAALYPSDQQSAPDDDWAAARAKLDAGFETLLLRLAYVQQLMEALKLKPKRDLLPLLALWAPIDTHGPGALYRRMFLNPTILRLDDVFQEQDGSYLDGSENLLDHEEALRAAFSLTHEELILIVEALGYDETTPLTLDNVSALFRHGFLARQLKLSVQELLVLLDLSGLDPFHPPDPVHPDAILFVELAQLVKASPFKVSQVLYYLRHEDLSGKASPTQEQILSFAQTLRADLERIEREHTVGEDPTGELTREKMALVYGSAVTDTFFGLLQNTSRYTTTYDHTQDVLQADILAVTDRLAYDDFQKQLSFQGVMTDAEKTTLDAAPSATGPFRDAVQALYDAARSEFQTFFDRYPNLQPLYEAYQASSDPVEQKLSALLADFLPALRAILKRQHIRQTVSAEVGVDLALVTALLETPALLHAAVQPGEAAIADFLGAETPGVSAAYHFAPNTDDPPDQEEPVVPRLTYGDGSNDLPANPDPGEDVISGVWHTYLEAPAAGAFNLYVEADAGAAITLSLEGEPVAFILEDGIWENQEAVVLDAGRLYALKVTAHGVQNTLVLGWAGQGIARESVPPSALYPAVLFDRFAATYLRLLKAIAIAEELEFSVAELEHFGTHADYQIDSEGWLNALPVAPNATDAATTQQLLHAFTALLHYDAIKNDLKMRDDRLVNVLSDPNATTEAGKHLLQQVTGWSETDRETLLVHFGLAPADLTHLHHLRRLHRAFHVVQALGIGAPALLQVTTNDPDADDVRDLQGALRARYDEEGWRKVLQPINDTLRRRQRDALVAFILHRLQQDEDTAHIDTADKLFEYFLIDVQMDPCMLTSRIKQALSTTQLFIQRCLLNLEPQVDAASINARQWAWMKRYRVWEANRKVFLFPENWLEPELRDNKSPFFKDFESELLQSDITDDAAATALLHYLEKLDEVAKLEVCGMHVQENEEGNPADDIVHVVARTAGTRRKYYYRRLEYGYWTPWEAVGVDIEDNPVIPVVWNNRLFLFWLSILQEGPAEPSIPITNSGKELDELTAADLEGDVDVEVKVTLYWSEHYNGKWQPPRTSNVKRPLSLGSFPASGDNAFDREAIQLSSVTGFDGDLVINVEYDGWKFSYFRLYNTHSLPVRLDEESSTSFITLHTGLLFEALGESMGAAGADSIDEVYIPYFMRTFVFKQAEWSDAQVVTAEDGTLVVRYFEQKAGDIVSVQKLSLDVLGNALVGETIEPYHPVKSRITAPFFVQDRRHVFFVRPARRTVPVGVYPDFGLVLETLKDTPSLVSQLTVKPELEDLVLAEGVFLPPFIAEPGVVDPNPVEHFLREGKHLNRAMAAGGTIRYDGHIIGPGGSVGRALTLRNV